ncbi:glycine betaine/proline transport system substrate-binding protein [Pullulanibacillus pueri]|uniref:Histidine ABC transporter substrate-binding protein n=1 Tax=Pullulanibacillus pueri TaxID=1437324 RepID=A0A8J3ENT4_9BACL|nr:ABC transporter substrate-binding protein [Pullulanibacillus pueri]MBM7683849.1 glycine betaine/proline transport system substrate-binding protein [Pullulanibacillus pueri]GGH87699.1 histidine ABC transporter substrate-binding protein [Pullulanibacillus pueri]
MKYKWSFIWIGMLCLLIGLGIYSGTQKSSADQSKGTIVFGDANWDSIRLHNFIAGFIVEHGYGYKMEVTSGSTAATFTGLRQGDIDVLTEVWPNNMLDAYNDALKKGDIKTVSKNYEGRQGFYVPTYMIKGDPDKGIKPMAPDLKTVDDLKKYANLFKDPEDPSKGRIIGGYSGSEAQKITQKQVSVFGLDDKFNFFTPGSEGALNASIVKAFKNHDAWVGYYWTPTWITAKYDLTLLKAPAYNKKIWEKNYGTEFPPDEVYISVNKDLEKKAPEVVKFLSQYKTSADLTGEALVYMQDNDASPEEAAQWWLKKHQDLWSKWVPEDVAEKVKSALK